MTVASRKRRYNILSNILRMHRHCMKFPKDKDAKKKLEKIEKLWSSA